MKIIHNSGKRKTAIAKATMKAGKGNVRINSILLKDYSPNTARMKKAINDFSNKIELKAIEKSKILDLYGKSKAFSVQELDTKVNAINSHIKSAEGALRKLQNGLSVYINTQESHERLKSYMKLYNNQLSNLKDDVKSLICRKFIDNIIIDWEKDRGHSIQIQYRLPLPEVQSSSSINVLSTNQDELNFGREDSFIVSKVFEKV